MDDSAFATLAQETLERLFDTIDAALGSEADVEFQGGILTLEFEDGRTFVINKHLPNREIWVSSPLSGAAHYAFDAEAQAWVSTRGGEVLHDVLARELGRLGGKAVHLE